MKIYQYPGCSSCKSALRWLKSHDLSVEAVDIVADPPDEATMRDLWVRSGLSLERLFNTSGQSYRSGGFKDRIKAMTEAEQIAALAADGKLIKRPLLDTGGLVLVGFNAASYAESLLEEGR